VEVHCWTQLHLRSARWVRAQPDLSIALLAGAWLPLGQAGAALGRATSAYPSANGTLDTDRCVCP
jgi:hypothetical protein